MAGVASCTSNRHGGRRADFVALAAPTDGERSLAGFGFSIWRLVRTKRPRTSGVVYATTEVAVLRRGPYCHAPPRPGRVRCGARGHQPLDRNGYRRRAGARRLRRRRRRRVERRQSDRAASSRARVATPPSIPSPRRSAASRRRNKAKTTGAPGSHPGCSPPPAADSLGVAGVCRKGRRPSF